MAFNSFNEDMDIISKLGDEPNEDDGLSADALKARFDLAGKKIKTFLNNLITTMAGATGAANIGFQSSTAVPENNVQDAIENVQQQITGVSQGAVPNNSISTEKLVDDAVTGAKVAAGTMRQDITGTSVMTVRRSEFTSITNGLKLHYFRALGMVFIEGVITVVPSAERQSATIDFSNYAPLPMGNDVYDICTDDATYRQASIVTANNSTSLVVTLKNISQSSFGSSLKIKIAGWYFCEGA